MDEQTQFLFCDLNQLAYSVRAKDITEMPWVTLCSEYFPGEPSDKISPRFLSWAREHKIAWRKEWREVSLGRMAQIIVFESN